MPPDGQLLCTRRLIALQYYAHLPPRDVRFQWPSPQSLLDIQAHLLVDLSLYQSEQDAKGDISYKKIFLKELIARLEGAVEGLGDDEAEVSGDLLEVFALLMASSTLGSTAGPSSQTVIYYYPTAEAHSRNASESLFAGWGRIVLREEVSTISRGTTGLKTCLRLAAHLLSRPDLIQGNLRLLELGSGSGLLGTLIARQFPRAHLHLTDLDGVVLDRLQQTVDENLSDAPNTTVSAIDWLDVADPSSASSRLLSSFSPHLVLAADIVYDPDLLDPLCKTLHCALTSKKGAVGEQSFGLIASTVRNEQTYARFFDTADKHGLDAHEEPLVRPTLNLESGTLEAGSSPQGHVDLFPSLHQSKHDGQVKLVKVKARMP